MTAFSNSESGELAKAHASHIAYADWLRTIAMMLVVMVHMSAPYLLNQQLTSTTANAWWSANLLMSLGRPGVLLFVMLSGALLLQPHKADESIAQFWRKRFVQILLPYLFWMVAFVGWRLWGRGETLSLAQVWREGLAGTVGPHLWYVPMLLGLYIATPVLRIYTSRASRQNSLYFIAIAAITSIVVPFIQRVWGFNTMLFEFLPFGGYMGFYVVGYYLRAVRVPRHWFRCLPLGVLLLAGVTAWLTGQATWANQGRISEVWLANLTPNVGLMAIGLFLWLKELPYRRWMQRWPWLKTCVKTVSQMSFGIYLSHVMLCELFVTGKLGFVLTTVPVSPYLTIPVLTMIVLSVSTIAMGFCQKIPILRRMVL